MTDAQAQEATAGAVAVAEETYAWEVWQDRPAGYGELHRHILERVGEIESDSPCRAWSWNGEQEALAEITRLAMGAGDFVLICGDRVQRVSVVGEKVYRFVKDEA